MRLRAFMRVLCSSSSVTACSYTYPKVQIESAERGNSFARRSRLVDLDFTLDIVIATLEELIWVCAIRCAECWACLVTTVVCVCFMFRTSV